MRLGLLFLGFSFLILASCSQQKICSAYQSSFIYDKETMRKKFSYFEEDSTPRVFLAASKNKYLVAVPESYRKKYQRLQTVDRRPVYPAEPDSLKELARMYAQADSVMELAHDSVYTTSGMDESGLVQKSPEFRITKTKEKYNNDQDYYMWFFRKTLVLPDIKYHLDRKASGKDDEEDLDEKEKPSKNQSVKPAPTKKRNPFKLPSIRNRSVSDSVTVNTGR